MRPLDLYIEKQACDRSIDAQSSRALSREVNDLSRAESLAHRQSLNLKDKSALASAGILIGSPLLLIGLGATFAACDEMDFRRRDRLFNDEKSNAGGRLLRKAQSCEPGLDATAVTEARAPLALMLTDISGLRKRRGGSARPGEGIFAAERKLSRSFVVPGKSFSEVDKLIKRKQFLKDQMERLHGKGNQLGAVGRLMSQLEHLDKLLKRMGC